MNIVYFSNPKKQINNVKNDGDKVIRIKMIVINNKDTLIVLYWHDETQEYDLKLTNLLTKFIGANETATKVVA